MEIDAKQILQELGMKIGSLEVENAVLRIENQMLKAQHEINEQLSQEVETNG